MPTEMPTIVRVSGHSTDHSSGTRWKQEGDRLRGKTLQEQGPVLLGSEFPSL